MKKLIPFALTMLITINSFSAQEGQDKSNYEWTKKAFGTTLGLRAGQFTLGSCSVAGLLGALSVECCSDKSVKMLAKRLSYSKDSIPFRITGFKINLMDRYLGFTEAVCDRLFKLEPLRRASKIGVRGGLTTTAGIALYEFYQKKIAEKLQDTQLPKK